MAQPPGPPPQAVRHSLRTGPPQPAGPGGPSAVTANVPGPSQATMAARPMKYFTEEQIARYRRVFNMFDINKNGVLEAQELAAVSKVMGYRMPKEQVLGMLKHFDVDVNGVLTFDEFLQAMPGNVTQIPESEHRRAELRQKFQEFDQDCNGFISRDEAHRVLRLELGFSEDRSRILLNQFDVNADGRLSYEEFVAFYSNVKDKREQIDKAFREFDREGKGYVSLEDAKRILGGMLFSNEEVEALVKAHDTNNDGVLQYHEFVHFWSV